MQSAYAHGDGMDDDADARSRSMASAAADLGSGVIGRPPTSPLPLGGTVTLHATAQLAGGGTAEATLKQERGAIVFTQTYGSKLDYSFVFAASGSNVQGVTTVHTEVQWARGVGGTNLESEVSTLLDWLGGPTQAWSNRTVTVWPPDQGYLPCLQGQQVVSTYDEYGELISNQTNTVGPPSVEWMEQSSASGHAPGDYAQSQPWSVSSRREVRLFTGGQAQRQSQGLFDLSASLTVEAAPDPDVARLALLL